VKPPLGNETEKTGRKNELADAPASKSQRKPAEKKRTVPLPRDAEAPRNCGRHGGLGPVATCWQFAPKLKFMLGCAVADTDNGGASAKMACSNRSPVSAAEVERSRVATLLTRRKSAINGVKKALQTARICQITLGLLS
jgi:hypothetical protein